MFKRILYLFSFIFIFALLINLSFAADTVPKKVLLSTESVVRVLSEYSDGYATGSGFVIKSDNKTTLIATNYHVVKDNPYNISVWIDEEETINAKVLAYSDQKDICVLELSYPIFLKALSFNNNSKQGDAVFAVGFPSAADYLSDKEAHISSDATITDGIISAIRETTISNHGQSIKLFQINAAINSGNSGGPLFNKNGEVIGINTYGINDSQGIFGAISISEFETFLKDNSIYISNKNTEINIYIVIVLIVLIVLFIFIFLFKNKYKNSNNNKKIQLIVIVLICFVIILICSYLLCYFKAIFLVKQEKFEEAKKLIFLSEITKLHDSKICQYIDAGLRLNNRKFEESKKAFSSISDYLNSKEMIKESDYRYAAKLADLNDFENSINIYKILAENNYKDSSEKLNDVKYRFGKYNLYQLNNYYDANMIFLDLFKLGYEDADIMIKETKYIEALDLIEKEEYIKAYKELNTIKDYSDSKNIIKDLKDVIYLDGKNLYYQKEYKESFKYFNTISDYLDSQKYIELLNAHLYYLSNDKKETIDKLCEIFYFEDASQILLSYSYKYAFLSGYWFSNDGQYYVFVELDNNHNQDKYIDKYILTSNIPRYSDSFVIEDGIAYSFNTPVYEFNLLTPDSMQVFCYKNGYTYTLYR